MLKMVSVGMFEDVAKLILIKDGKDILMGVSLPCVLSEAELEKVKGFFDQEGEKKLIINS